MDDAPRRRLVNDLARGIFTGRVAIWGVAVPLAALVVAWCRILIMGDEDAALEFGGRWGEWYALWVFGLVVALVARNAIPAALAERRRRRRIADVHASLARALGRKPTRPEKKPNPLATADLAVVVIAMILALAAPAVTCGGRTPLWDFFGVSLGVAGMALGVKKFGDTVKAEEERQRFCRWKARREARRADRGVR